MNNTDVFAKFKISLSKIEPKFDIDSITSDSSLKDDLDLDSLDVIELLMILEEDFGLEINLEELVDITTVGDACGIIEELI
jgi:acyl carrier protein